MDKKRAVRLGVVSVATVLDQQEISSGLAMRITRVLVLVMVIVDLDQ